MTYRVNTNMPLQDIGLRFCSCCLMTFCPKPENLQSETVRFFVPTIDVLHRYHFAYVEVPYKFAKLLHSHKEKFSVDLYGVANVLHLEMGDFPTPEREQEIISFYDLPLDITYQSYNRLAA